jgi:hypothetical protein
VVVDKPAGMVVHPGAGNPAGTLVNALLAHCTDLSGIGGELRPGIVHRLDKDTSGCIVVAKNERSLAALQAQFKRRDVQKVYLALVHGTVSAKGRFETLHGRHPTDRLRFTSKVRAGRSAVTEWERIGACAGASLVRARSCSLPQPPDPHALRRVTAQPPLLATRCMAATRREARLGAGDPVRRAAQAAGPAGAPRLEARSLAPDHPSAAGLRGRRPSISARALETLGCALLFVLPD